MGSFLSSMYGTFLFRGLVSFSASRCVGVFDTVGSMGLPAELTSSSKVRQLFDFPDNILPEHIERAYHAMALDERRQDFVSG